MGEDVLSQTAFVIVKQKAKAAGSTTYAGEERRRQGLGLDPLVDPAGFGVIRRSLCRFVPEGDYFLMPNGVAMPNETLLDGTGSMGRVNIDAALYSLKHSYDLQAGYAFKRYDPQIATAMFGDCLDPCVLQRTQFEMAEKIAIQMTLFDLAGFSGQGNYHENPEYGIFGATFLSDFDIWRYDLKSYHHTLSDEAIEFRLDPREIERVFGKNVWEILKDNGHDLTPRNLPTTPEMVQVLLKRTHAFFYSFNPNYKAAITTWKECYGKERFIEVSRIEHFHFYQAAVTALTEGAVDLKTVNDLLKENGLGAEYVGVIQKAVANIPFGAQAALPNFGMIPLKGAKFSKKRDLWPMKDDPEQKPSKEGGSLATKKKGKMWL